MSDRYVFGVAIESLFLRALDGRVDVACRAKLREAGIDLDEPVLAAYPAEVFHRGVAIAAQAVHPSAPPDQAQFEIGRAHIDGFVTSYPGRMMLALARQLEPRTILEYTATFIRLGNNFTESRCRALGDGQTELWMNHVYGVPHWYRGIIHRGLELAGVRGLEVRHAGGDEAATYVVSWQA